MNAVAVFDDSWHPLVDGNPPDWATGWGHDCYGVFVDFAVGGVTQRLRWIPPGPFLMGSPEDEAGRTNWEGPQHKVTLSRGFWLFATPCTQALWEAVMKGNPSQIKSPDRPVEQVSWDEVQGFLARLNERMPGLDLGLPSEAQWEYACRADTVTAHYAGGDALDTIAWHKGNSGHETHPVGLKRPNDWGLYDMLGNVWEWCADGKRDYGAEPVTDPHGPLAAGAARVVRGGSWYGDARSLRAAFRGWGHPEGRDGNLGFRCARVQVS